MPQLFAVVGESRTVTDYEVNQATEMQLDVAKAAVRLEQALLEVASRLATESIRFAVLKGAATARLDYRSPGQRQFGDIHLLVEPSEHCSRSAFVGGSGLAPRLRAPVPS